MGVNEGSLQVIEYIEVIMEIWPIVLLYGTYLPVALVVFIIHAIFAFCDSVRVRAALLPKCNSCAACEIRLQFYVAGANESGH